MFRREYNSQKALIALNGSPESLPAPVSTSSAVRAEIHPGAIAIISQDESLARRVYESSLDKANPDFQPVLRFLRENGYRKLESVSRLPSLQSQGNYEEIADLILEGPDAKFLSKEASFGYVLTQRTFHEVWEPAAKSRPEDLLACGLAKAGLNDKTYLPLFQDIDLVRIIAYMREHNPELFTNIPSGGVGALRQQLAYVEDWKKTLMELGKSAIREKCRNTGVPDTEVGEHCGKNIDTLRTCPVTREAILYQLRKGKAINPTIQSLEVYVRMSGVWKSDVFAFVERAAPKGLDIVCETDLEAYGLIADILCKGEYSHKNPNALAKDLKSVQAYEKSVADQRTWAKRLAGACSLGGAVSALIHAAAIDAALFGATGCALTVAGIYGLYSKYVNPPAPVDKICESLPFPGLSEQARRNYLNLYKLEGLTETYHTLKRRAELEKFKQMGIDGRNLSMGERLL